MAEDDENKLQEDESLSSAAESENSEQKNSERAENEENKGLIQSLFTAGNKLLTLPNSQTISIGDDTRRLLALFSNGQFLVVETHKFDGRVMSFQVLAKRKGLRFGQPIFVTQNELNAPTTKKRTSNASPIASSAPWMFSITSHIAPPLKFSGDCVSSCQTSASFLFHVFKEFCRFCTTQLSDTAYTSFSQSLLSSWLNLLSSKNKISRAIFIVRLM